MYKTLLVPVDGKSRNARSVELACRVARTFEAHVVGMFVEPSPRFPANAFAEGSSAILVELQAKAIRELSAAAKATFDKAGKAAGQTSVEWRVAEGDPVDAVALNARYADLVVINQS